MAREGACYREVPHPLNLTPQSRSPFIRKFDQLSTPELHPWRHKRMKTYSDGKDTSTIPWLSGVQIESKYKRDKFLPDVIDYSDPFSVPNLNEELDRSIYGSVAKDIEDLRERRSQMLNPLLALYPKLASRRLIFSPPPNGKSKEVSHLISRTAEVIHVDEERDDIDSHSNSVSKSSAEKIQGYSWNAPSVDAFQEPIACMKLPNVDNDLPNHNNMQVVILDSDEEDGAEQIGTTEASRYSQETLHFEVPQASQLKNLFNIDIDRGKGLTVLDANQVASSHYRAVLLKKPIDENAIKDSAGLDGGERKIVKEESKALNAETEPKKDKGVYVGVQDDDVNSKNSSQCDFDDGLGDIWREMTVAMECNKDAPGDIEHSEDEDEEECDHTFILKDDLGYVCRVCGIIRKSIETIFDFQWVKGSKSTRTYMPESWSMKERGENDAPHLSGVNSSHDLAAVDISLHPRHMKQMKEHQLEGFNFLVKNLISDDPGGCILAHAPGSGKTFMIISFIQSFLAKLPHARPLVVLPKGILGTWKREFIRWQIEDMPLYDFYSSKAESRKEQLDILKEWVENKGILFLGYKQFANIVCKSESNAAAACQDILLRVPSILILDAGHTPRNEAANILHSLEKVQTPRKVVLSGTLFQNHVKEVFNILNLVRPKFLRSDTSKAIKRRVMSRGCVGRKQIKAGGDDAFFDVVETTLQKDTNTEAKVAVIQDLRAMTRNVLHYHKGDFLDELPGLVDLTVFLNLSSEQKPIVEELKKLEKFKRTSIGTAVYVHPRLKEFSENATMADKGCNFNEDKMNDIISKINFRDGLKAKFFLNILGLCESSGEKLLVFSQYLLPLKFLEKLVVNTKGWTGGKEIFTINGDTTKDDREWFMERFNNSPDAKGVFWINQSVWRGDLSRGGVPDLDYGRAP